MRTKISLNTQSKVTDDVIFSNFNIKEIADPVDDLDAVNKRTLLEIVNNSVSSGSGVIGTSEDGTYTDGLFVDFTEATPVGTAVDRFNEVLKSLSPQPAPNLSSISCSTMGVSGKLSFGETNNISGYTNVRGLNINSNFSVSSTRIGILNNTTSISGVLANNVTPNYTNSRPYPNLSFGNGDQGILKLVLNGVVIHSVDLSLFVSGLSLTNSSGFTLSPINSVQFSNGDLFSVFKYRTGTYTIHSSNLVKGYNYFQIIHTVGSSNYSSQIFDLVVDDNVNTTTFISETLTSLNMTGTKYLSGVNYNTSGTAKYGVTISNGYKNTYSALSFPITHSGSNATLASDSISNMTTENDQIVLTNKNVIINATRLLNGSISMNSSLDRTVQSDLTSSGINLTGILLDNVSDNDSNTVIYFNGENRRIRPSVNTLLTNYGTGLPGTQQSPWDSTESLVGINSDYNTGLQVYNGSLIYPKINFSTFASQGPLGNPDYSNANGNRTFLVYFYDSLAHSNFKFNIVSSNTSFVPISSGVSNNNLNLEILAPNTTTNGINLGVWKDAVTPYSTDNNIGCYASTYGNIIPTNWGCTLGTKNTSTSGNVILIKITASSNWSGSIDTITLTWL